MREDTTGQPIEISDEDLAKNRYSVKWNCLHYYTEMFPESDQYMGQGDIRQSSRCRLNKMKLLKVGSTYSKFACPLWCPDYMIKEGQ